MTIVFNLNSYTCQVSASSTSCTKTCNEMLSQLLKLVIKLTDVFKIRVGTGTKLKLNASAVTINTFRDRISIVVCLEKIT